MRIVLLIIYSLICGLTFGQEPSINVKIQNFKNEKGVCRACLFASSAGFPGDTSIAYSCKVAPIKGNQSTLVFSQIPPGNYAISVYHDENNDNQLNENFFGIPQEGYGASGNNLPAMSKPAFSANAFSVKNKSLNITINLRY